MSGRFKSSYIGVFALTLGACAGGGGGGNGGSPSSTPPPPVTPAALPNPMPSPVTSPTSENFDTSEYRNSSAAIGANVLPAWQAGASGRGITLGFVDTGIKTNFSDFAGRISPLSQDVNGTRPMDDLWGHGTAVAGIAAAAHDGKGMEGIAYEATIFMAKADQGCPDNCKFPFDAIARGIDAARMAGAKAVNLSIAGNENSDVLAAVRRAVSAGMIIVIGAGNSGSDPSDLAMQLASSAPGQVIIVGGLGISNADGSINYNVPSIYTTPAGTGQSSFLTAPGWLNSASYFRADGGIDKLSGTSFAAPVVTGAIALIAQAFPMLSAQQIVLLLYATADDLGAAGVDATFGRGRLNIGRAFLPVGTLRLAGTSSALPASLGSLPTAAGDAARLDGLRATILDSFERPFQYNLSANLSGQRQSGPLASLVRSSHRSAFTSPSLAFIVDAGGPRPSSHGLFPDEQRSARLLAAKAIARLTGNSSLAFGYGIGASALHDQLSGKSDVANMLSTSASAELGFASRNITALALGHKAGNWRLSLAGLRGSIPVGRREQDAPYSLMSWSVQWERLDTRFRAGTTWLNEPDTILGGRLNPLFGRGDAQTWFGDLEAERRFGGGWSVSGAYRRGWTSFSAGRFATTATSFQVSKVGLSGPSDALSLRIHQPLRVEAGGLDVVLPVSWDYLAEMATLARRRMSFTPSGREILSELAYQRNLRAGSVGINAFVRRQPGHVETAAPDIGMALRADLKL